MASITLVHRFPSLIAVPPFPCIKQTAKTRPISFPPSVPSVQSVVTIFLSKMTAHT